MSNKRRILDRLDHIAGSVAENVKALRIEIDRYEDLPPLDKDAEGYLIELSAITKLVDQGESQQREAIRMLVSHSEYYTKTLGMILTRLEFK